MAPADSLSVQIVRSVDGVIVYDRYDQSIKQDEHFKEICTGFVAMAVVNRQLEGGGRDNTGVIRGNIQYSAAVAFSEKIFVVLIFSSVDKDRHLKLKLAQKIIEKFLLDFELHVDGVTHSGEFPQFGDDLTKICQEFNQDAPNMIRLRDADEVPAVADEVPMVPADAQSWKTFIVKFIACTALVIAVLLGIHHLRQQTVHFLFPKNCFEELIVKFNVRHSECCKLVISHFLGLAIVVGSAFVKIPQIFTIWRGRSAAGLSIVSLVLELVQTSTTFSYSYANRFHFSAWGESCFVGLQTVVVAFLIVWYADRKGTAVAFLFRYVSLLAVLCSATPVHVLAVFQACNIPIIVVKRAIQAVENYHNQRTTTIENYHDQLSPVTCFFLFAVCVARIFTSVQETGDRLLIITYVAGAVMNGLIFFQVLFYSGKKRKGKLP